MPSVASGGATERMTARTLFKVVRAGSGTRYRYSFTVLGTFVGLPLFFFFTLTSLLPQMLQYLSRRVRARAPGQACTRMGAAAAKIQVFDRRAIAGPVQQRAHGEKLVEREIAVEDLAAG